MLRTTVAVLPVTGCGFAQHRARLVADPPSLLLDGTVRYRMAWALAVPRAGGVYLVHDLRGTLYVGRGEDLRRRFEEHLAGSHNLDLRSALLTTLGQVCFSWVIVAAPEQIELERSLIRSLRPLCNIQHNSIEEGCT